MLLFVFGGTSLALHIPSSSGASKRYCFYYCYCFAQAQCQKDLKGLNKQIESKQGDLEKAQQELQQQQAMESAVQRRIAEAERQLQVTCAPCSCTL